MLYNICTYIYIWYGRHGMVWYGNGKYIHDNLHHFYISHLGSQVQAPGPPSSPTPSSRNGSRTNGREVFRSSTNGFWWEKSPCGLHNLNWKLKVFSKWKLEIHQQSLMLNRHLRLPEG